MSLRIAAALAVTIGAGIAMSPPAQARPEMVGMHSAEYSPGTIVVKTDVLSKHPWIARALYDAFTAAEAPYLERLKRGDGHKPEDQRYRALTPLVGDPLPYGMRANRASIEALMTYALQQKLIPERMPLDQACRQSAPRNRARRCEPRHACADDGDVNLFHQKQVSRLKAQGSRRKAQGAS